MKSRKKGLGKGLDALLSTTLNHGATPTETPPLDLSGDASFSSITKPNFRSNVLIDVPVDICQRGKYQPRREIADETLNELSQSIKNQGVMQPIILRPLENNAKGSSNYEIIAGERRWRAAQIAGLKTIPAIIKEADDESASAMALVENLQREDLNPMEEAYALSRLIEDFGLTHQQASELVGKSRVAVSNLLRLISLSKEVRQMLELGNIDMGHARALIGLPQKQQYPAAKKVFKNGLSVRQAEALVKKLLNPANKTTQPVIGDPNIAKLQTQLSERLGVPVLLNHQKGGSGKLIIKYHSLDELDGVLKHID